MLSSAHFPPCLSDYVTVTQRSNPVCGGGGGYKTGLSVVDCGGDMAQAGVEFSHATAVKGCPVLTESKGNMTDEIPQIGSATVFLTLQNKGYSLKQR